MLNKFEEYQKMFEVEDQLWWYKVLHEKVLKSIELQFKENKNIKILDAGCGTGGLLIFLLKNGYKNIQGFDYSKDAVNFCKKRNLSVQELDILSFNITGSNQIFDVIICNDVLYQFDNKNIEKILLNIYEKISKQGIFISNNNALNIFKGTHDIIVGGKQRFKISSFNKNIHHLFDFKYYTYWSFIISPLILSIRLIQQIKLKLGLIEMSKIKSDINLPPKIVNKFLYKSVKFEEFFFTSYFFGSSLYMVFEKDKN